MTTRNGAKELAAGPPPGSSGRATPVTERYTRTAMLAGMALYLVVVTLYVGLRAEHIVLGAAYSVVSFLGPRALRFLVLLLPVTLTGVVYDLARLTVPLRGEVHVSDLYAAEAAWFGIGSAGEIPAAFLAKHTSPVLDLLTGGAYLIYLYVPIVVSAAMYFRNHQRMLEVGLAFFFTNLIGMVVYLAYPAAPPWYVFEHGLGPARLDVLPSAAGAARFDALLGVQYFQEFYSRNCNVFGAMPSLHVAFPAATLFAMSDRGKRWVIPLAALTLLVAFAAIYLQHHYVLDVVAGVACAAVGYGLARFTAQRLMAREVGEHARAVA